MPTSTPRRVWFQRAVGAVWTLLGLIGLARVLVAPHVGFDVAVTVGWLILGPSYSVLWWTDKWQPRPSKGSDPDQVSGGTHGVSDGT